MEFFSSLAKTEQKTFSDMAMSYAGPSKEHMHIGCLAGALWRCAEADKKKQSEEPDEELEYHQKEHFFFTHNGVSFPVRATLENIGGFTEDDAEDVPRYAIQTEVRCKMAYGCVTWKDATRVYVEKGASLEQAYWASAEKLLPKLKAMIKCVGCKCDIIERVKVFKPDGSTFLSQHCSMCTTRQWDEPCTKCGNYIGERGPESRHENGRVNKYSPYCIRCE